MTNAPRTEDAWRDATMAPRYTAEAEAAKWKRVALAMYGFAQTLENEPSESARQLEQERISYRHLAERCQDQRMEIERLKQKITDAKETLT